MKANVEDEYKFRISCKMQLRAKETGSEFEFRYSLLSEAKQNYKAILLGLYRRKDIKSFSICLNRCKDQKWRHAIHKETVSAPG